MMSVKCFPVVAHTGVCVLFFKTGGTRNEYGVEFGVVLSRDDENDASVMAMGDMRWEKFILKSGDISKCVSALFWLFIILKINFFCPSLVVISTGLMHMNLSALINSLKQSKL